MAVGMGAVSWTTMSVSVTLTLLAAGALFWPRGQTSPQPPLWCLYDIDNPFDVARSGGLCSLIVVCCLVDERALDALADLAEVLGTARLENNKDNNNSNKVLLMLWPPNGDWFWQQLCNARVAEEFARVFIEAAEKFNLAGVLRGRTNLCQSEAVALERGLLDKVRNLAPGSKPITATIWDDRSRDEQQKHEYNPTSYVLIWLQQIINNHEDLPTERCGFNVTARVTEASAAARQFSDAKIVHVISARWHLVHSDEANNSSESESRTTSDEIRRMIRKRRLNPSYSCDIYPIPGSTSTYIRPGPRALRQMLTRLVGGRYGPNARPLLVTDLAEDELAADLVGQPQATILRQMHTILRDKIISY